MEQETIQKYKCYKCNKEFDNTDDLDLGYGENQEWICKNCQEENYLNKYEIIYDRHNSEENALIVENYPYGFKRTKIKYWIETTKNGDRFVSQTLNPKTLKWNKPKKTTYSDVMVLVKEKKTGYTRYRSWGVAYTSYGDLKRFLDFCENYEFNDLQKEQIKRGKAIYKTREHISFEIVEHKEEDELQELVRKKEEERQRNDINKLFGYYYSKED